MPNPTPKTPDLKWHKWEDSQPTNPGVYFWRVASEALPGEVVMFTAPLSSVNDIIVPPFFRWTGWTPAVPPCEWAEPTEDLEAHHKHDYKNLSILGLKFASCPFCGKTPILEGIRRADGGGVILPADPHYYNCWWLKCCQWGKTPSYKNPRDIERVRQEAFTRIKEGKI